MLRRLYDWTMAKAADRRAEWWLAAFAFVEASFFPVPPHPLLGLMCLAEELAKWLESIGATDVHVLKGGTKAWAEAGYILFSGVNVPSKAFGEWVEHHYGTESVDPPELKQWIESGRDMIVLDSRTKVGPGAYPSQWLARLQHDRGGEHARLPRDIAAHQHHRAHF